MEISAWQRWNFKTRGIFNNTVQAIISTLLLWILYLLISTSIVCNLSCYVIPTLIKVIFLFPLSNINISGCLLFLLILVIIQVSTPIHSFVSLFFLCGAIPDCLEQNLFIKEMCKPLSLSLHTLGELDPHIYILNTFYIKIHLSLLFIAVMTLHWFKILFV